jgi:hypothetical protein
MARKPTFMDELMNEHIPLPGCPQIIVTRGWAYQWLKDRLGYDPSARGFASIDYLVFGRRKSVALPLTDLTAPHIAATLALIEATEKAAR